MLPLCLWRFGKDRFCRLAAVCIKKSVRVYQEKKRDFITHTPAYDHSKFAGCCWHFSTSDVAQACQKSLDAAIRSKRANIAEALRAKLTKLEAERSPKSCEAKRVPKKKRAALENASEDSKTSKVKKAKNVKKVLKKNPAKQKSTFDDAKRDALLVPDTTSTLKTVKHGSKSTKMEPRETPRKKVKRKTRKNQGSSGELPSDSARATAIDLLLRAAAKAKAARQAAGEESEEEAPMPELPTPRSWGGWGGGSVQEAENRDRAIVM